MKLRISTLAGLISLIVMAACGSGSAGGIEVQEPWIRAVGATENNTMDMGTMIPNANQMPAEQPAGSMIGSTGAAFMTIKNNGKAADRLVSVDSDVADAVEIHLSEMKDDVMTMRQVDGVEIPAGGEALLQPGGYHVMLIGLQRELAVGEKVNLTLTFEKAGQMSVEAEVRAIP